MRRIWRLLGVALAVLLFATAAGATLPRFAFKLLSPHTAKRSAAVFDPALARAVDASLSKATIESVDGAIDYALGASDKILHFGLEHPTSLAFTAAEREGNCIEYAHLFARVFDAAAAKAKLDARAYVVHSGKALLLGRAVPMRGWENHDWVLVQEGKGDDAKRWFIDPTLHDYGFGWDISPNVEGDVKLPADR